MYEGTANTYAPPGPDGNVEIAERDIPYRTRLIVRRPANQSRFNGVVIVEWFNVTNQYDTDVLWLYQKEFFIRERYAWVGVSAQNVGLSRAANGAQGLESGTLRDARRHQRRQDHRRRARGGHLFASRHGRSPRSRGPRRTQAHVPDRRRPVAVGEPARPVSQRPASSRARLRRRPAHGEQPGDPARHQDSRHQGVERDRAQQRAAAGRHAQGPRLAGDRLDALGAILAALTRRVPEARSRPARRGRVRDPGAIARRNSLRLQRRDRCAREMAQAWHCGT